MKTTLILIATGWVTWHSLFSVFSMSKQERNSYWWTVYFAEQHICHVILPYMTKQFWNGSRFGALWRDSTRQGVIKDTRTMIPFVYHDIAYIGSLIASMHLLCISRTKAWCGTQASYNLCITCPGNGWLLFVNSTMRAKLSQYKSTSKNL